jgi:hypothetical protein
MVFLLAASLGTIGGGSVGCRHPILWDVKLPAGSVCSVRDLWKLKSLWWLAPILHRSSLFPRRRDSRNSTRQCLSVGNAVKLEDIRKFFVYGEDGVSRGLFKGIGMVEPRGFEPPDLLNAIQGNLAYRLFYLGAKYGFATSRPE